MGKFEGVLLCTDLDGTLFKNDKSISKENIEAIEYFKSEGGLFTFISGRMPYFATDVYDLVKPNAPIGCSNGAGLYDYSAGKYVWQCPLSREALSMVEDIDKKFSEVGIQINTFEHVYFCKENNVMEHFRKITGVPNLVSHYYDVTEPIAKVVFGSSENEVILKVKDALLSHPLSEKFGYIRSEHSLFEILPLGVSKGTAIKELCRALNISKERTVAVGDYENDIPMFSVAGVGIAVENACEKAKLEADYITVSNEENAIAKVIYDLGKGLYPI